MQYLIQLNVSYVKVPIKLHVYVQLYMKLLANKYTHDDSHLYAGIMQTENGANRARRGNDQAHTEA